MGLWDERILPRLTELTCGGEGMAKFRRRAVEGLAGTVVEVGFGTGLNVAEYPDAVTRVYAVEPNERARQLAARRIERSRVPVEFIGLDGQAVPLPDDSCDAALVTFVLCTIPDVGRALSELRRVLRPGGELHFLEHGRSPEPGVHRWQQRLEPMQKRLAGGCHLTRDVEDLLVDAGFEIDRLTQRDVAGPAPWTYFSWGVAHVPADRPVEQGAPTGTAPTA